MEHMNFIKDMFEWGLQHISTRKHVILPDALVGATQNSQKHKQYLDRCYIFLEYLEHLLVIPYHSVKIMALSMVGFMLN